MITLVITSCSRVNLLRRTFSSFLKYNDIPVSKIILIDDSGEKHVHNEIEAYFKLFDLQIPVLLLFNKHNFGQVESIDMAYSKVDTPYIFHLENDWEFLRPGFMGQSLKILEADPFIFTVWLRGEEGMKVHPAEDKVLNIGGVDCRFMTTGALGGNWHGFTWNPGLRRLSDYKKFGNFIDYKEVGDFAALTECRIGQKYFDHGFRAVTVLDQYVKHIG